jgi:hypothetical protein
MFEDHVKKSSKDGETHDQRGVTAALVANPRLSPRGAQPSTLAEVSFDQCLKRWRCSRHRRVGHGDEGRMEEWTWTALRLDSV